MDIEYPQQKLLIVDDTHSDIMILKDLFASYCRTCFAGNGEEALESAVSDDPPHLIILDVILPDMDGYEVCRRLKADSRTRDIPVIFITVKDQHEDEIHGLELGAVDYITKPFFLPVVSARVKTHLELKRHRDILERLSSLDGLTGVPNRRSFDDYYFQEWKNAIREGTFISMIMIDIDHFKAYNDNYGHTRGDECLKEVAKGLAASLRRPKDFAARYGGEEFAVILPGTDQEGALHIAEILKDKITSMNIPHDYSPVAAHITISLGVATHYHPSMNAPPDALREASDRALYQAKRAGRDRIKSIDMTSRI